MSDITREFLDELEEEFDKRYSSSKKIQSLVKKLKEGTATCEDAFEYSKEVGNLRKLVLHDNITEEILNDGYLGYRNALSLFSDVLYSDYELINQYCKNSFTQVNKRQGINLNSLSVEYNRDKTDGIIECAVKGKYEDVRNETEEAVVTNAKSYYDSSVRKNADFQYKSGLSPKIIRTAIGKTCKWCQSLAGTYDYYDVSDTGNDVFRRHANCDCLVVYSPKKGKYQDVWNKRIYQTQMAARIEKIQELSTSHPIKRNYLRITEVRASIINEMVDRGEISLKLSMQNYNNHVPGTMEYERKMKARADKNLNPQSILTITFEEAQEIINKYSGTGIIKRNKNGEIIKTERITCDRVIGKCCTRGIWYETNKAQIHHANDGSHLVPILGSKYD